MGVKVIIPAAGSGKRIGKDKPKQYISLAGLPLLVHTISRFEKSGLVDEIVLVVRKDEIAWVRENILKGNNLRKVKKVVEGGKERQDSVASAIKWLWNITEDNDIIMVHDGARPFLPQNKIHECIHEAQKSGACVLGLKVTETLKMADGEGMIRSTLSSGDIWVAQTPQAFKWPLLKEAYLRAREDGFYGTDEAALVERLPHPIRIIPGVFWNIKITFPEDFQLAEQIIKMGIVS
ncbi:MAG: 2-C-methyl-D-erythritol 4-phosphate cytidylyltransferase [bacterium]